MTINNLILEEQQIVELNKEDIKVLHSDLLINLSTFIKVNNEGNDRLIKLYLGDTLNSIMLIVYKLGFTIRDLNIDDVFYLTESPVILTFDLISKTLELGEFLYDSEDDDDYLIKLNELLENIYFLFNQILINCSLCLEDIIN